MTELIVTRGLPASGKTTYARNYIGEPSHESRARLNRDDIRHMLFGVYWGLSYQQEEIVSRVQQRSLDGLLRTGTSVVVDDTNLRVKHARALVDIAEAAGVEWRVVDFNDVTVEECIRRDELRREAGERSVGADVIRGMADRYGIPQRWPEEVFPTVRAATSVAYRYEPDVTLPPTWLFDLDGTLAHMNGRGPFEWHRVGEDRFNKVVGEVTRALCWHDNDVVFVSGRDESCRSLTLAWLRDYFRDLEINNGDLVMRPEGDNRKDSVVKLELFREHIAPRYQVLGVFDDRDQVVEMWRSIGLTCFQVAPGAF